MESQEVGFDPRTEKYATTWPDFGTNGERCHGPGSRHVERYRYPERFAEGTRCHEAVGGTLPVHTRHKPPSPGSACLACHLPRTATSIKARMRGPAISIPVPEVTVRYGAPNACNECHAAQSAEGVAKILDESRTRTASADRPAGRGVHPAGATPARWMRS